MTPSCKVQLREILIPIIKGDYGQMELADLVRCLLKNSKAQEQTSSEVYDLIIDQPRFTCLFCFRLAEKGITHLVF
jgi:hypothetical protein